MEKALKNIFFYIIGNTFRHEGVKAFSWDWVAFTDFLLESEDESNLYELIIRWFWLSVMEVVMMQMFLDYVLQLKKTKTIKPKVNIYT